MITMSPTYLYILMKWTFVWLSGVFSREKNSPRSSLQHIIHRASYRDSIVMILQNYSCLIESVIVKVVYNDKLVYKVVIWVFGGYFMKRDGSFKCSTIIWSTLRKWHFNTGGEVIILGVGSCKCFSIYWPNFPSPPPPQ